MKKIISIVLLASLLTLALPSSALALRYSVIAYDKTPSNADPNNPTYVWTGVFGWNYE